LKQQPKPRKRKTKKDETLQSSTKRSTLSIDDERMSEIDRELIEEARENNLPEVSRLLSVGADVNVSGNLGWTPLHWACFRGHLQVFNELLDHGADIEAKSNFGRTPLHFACRAGRLSFVNELVSPNDSNATTTILGKRKSRGGANIDAKDNNGETPLHGASHNGYLAIVKALLAVGADILAANNFGNNPIYQAVSSGKSEVSKCLLQQLYATTRRLPLHELVEDLTWIGNLNSSGAPPLRAALHHNVLGTDDVVEIIEYLVNRDPTLLSSRGEDGLLPLHLACRRGASFTFVQSLVNLYQASVKSVTPQGDLPLFLACEIPEASLNTIFLLMKVYPDVVYR
jgi:ankyrin repeat protein